MEGAVDSPRAGRMTVRRQIVVGCERERAGRQGGRGEQETASRAEQRRQARAIGRDAGPER